MSIKCIIVDDEHLARVLLESYVEKIPGLELVQKCKSPLEALECLQNNTIDLMFLDIQMPDLTGIELLESLQHPPAVILTTAYQEYALKGFELNVQDYLVKPISFERFLKGVNKVVEQIQLKKSATSFGSNQENKEHILVKADHKIYKLKFDDLLYVEGLKEYVAYHTADRKIVALASLKGLEEILPSDRFLRIHKSFIIAKDAVVSLEGNQVEIAGQKLPIGKSYKDAVMEQLF